MQVLSNAKKNGDMEFFFIFVAKISRKDYSVTVTLNILPNMLETLMEFDAGFLVS